MYDVGIPVCLIKLLINRYSKISVFIKWNNCYSSQCLLKSGVRQGGVLSPIRLLFNTNIGSVIESLVLADLGCHIQGTYIRCLIYADDIMLLFVLYKRCWISVMSVAHKFSQVVQLFAPPTNPANAQKIPVINSEKKSFGCQQRPHKY